MDVMALVGALFLGIAILLALGLALLYALGEQLTAGLFNMTRKIMRKLGYELAVDLGAHDIEISMVRPGKDTIAWDHSLYRWGNVFVLDTNGDRYANPVVHTVDRSENFKINDLLKSDELITTEKFKLAIQSDAAEQLIQPRGMDIIKVLLVVSLIINFVILSGIASEFGWI